MLVTGRGTSGSWRIRGEQLGTAIGAAVVPKALDVAGFSLAVVVKRAETELLRRLRRGDVPIVWDIVDAWPQPDGNTWGKSQCMAWLREVIAVIRPVGVVAPTEAMAADLREFDVPVLCVPHHARPGIARNPIRDSVAVVGYEGAERYIDRWRPVIEAQCRARGWRFVVNPERLADVDIVLALRDACGYAPRHWKSGVKLANAQGSGTPFIGCREAGYLETAADDGPMWADTPAELGAAFDELTPAAERRRRAALLVAAAPRIEAVASRYRAWLEELACATAGRS